MISDSLMNGAHQVRRIALVDGEAEFSLGIGFGMADLFHSGCQLDQDHFVAGGRFVGGAVGDSPVEGGGE
jgi:hypothetical protein